MGKVANTVLRLKRQETHRIFDRFWREQGWTRSAAYRWLAQNLHLKEHETHIGMMEMDECEQVIRLCRKYGKHKKEAAYGDAFESMYILAKGKPKTVHILKDKPNKWAGTKTWGCLTKREVDGTLTPKGRKTIQKFGARTNVWHYGTVLPMESELFGGKAVSLSERLAEDHIRTWSNEGDLVLAPFDKDGTVAKIAPLLERRWLSLQNAADCDGLRDNAG